MNLTGSDAVQYLVGRGYPGQQANQVVRKLETAHQPLDESALLFNALRMGMQ